MFRTAIIIILLFNSFMVTDVLYANNINNNSDGYIILNLHWADGEITLNNLKKVVGFTKKAGRRAVIHPFFYTILSEEGETIRASYFKIPKKLHYDYFDESTGKLNGGQLKRDELDFVIRVPLFHQAKQIMFYKTDEYSDLRIMKSVGNFDGTVEGELLGKINF